MNENDEPTEMTAMTGPSSHDEAGGVSSSAAGFSNNINSIIVNNNNNNHHPMGLSRDNADSAPFGRAWLKKQLRSPAGKCLFLVALLGLSVLAAYLGSKIVLGALFMQECQEEPFVPIYLVVSSSFFILFIAVLCVIFLRCRHRYEEEESISPIYLLSLVYAFLHLVLQLAGSVCVIRTSDRLGEITREDEKHCNDTLLTYAFGVVVFELILTCILFALTMALLCQVIYAECCKSNKAHINAPP